MQVAGKKEDVSGMALMIPELNASDLTEQGSARELLRQFAEVRFKHCIGCCKARNRTNWLILLDSEAATPVCRG